MTYRPALHDSHLKQLPVVLLIACISGLLTPMHGNWRLTEVSTTDLSRHETINWMVSDSGPLKKRPGAQVAALGLVLPQHLRGACEGAVEQCLSGSSFLLRLLLLSLLLAVLALQLLKVGPPLPVHLLFGHGTGGKDT